MSADECMIIGYLLYYFGISMFCWMSVMSYDLFITFGRPGSSTHLCRNRPKTFRQMVRYSSLAFGVPAAMAVGIYLIDMYNLVESFKPGIL